MLFGGIAQLGERLNGIQEVRGSNPLISTIKNSMLVRFVRSGIFLCFFFARILHVFSKKILLIFCTPARRCKNAAAVFFDTYLTLSYNPRLVVKVCFYLTICETADFAVNYRSKGE